MMTLKTEKADFQFIIQIMNEFFEQDEIIQKLIHIDVNGIHDWEKWLQIELSFFFQNHADIMEWKREHRIALDKRSSKTQNFTFIDFFIRQKYKQSSIPLEIKQHDYANRCIPNMLNDIEKYRKIRSSQSETNRKLWCIGIHKIVQEEYVRQLITDRSHCDEEFIFIKAIPKTNFMMTIL